MIFSSANPSKNYVMKRILLCIVLYSCLFTGMASAQFGGAKPTPKEDIALMWIDDCIENIDNLSEKQLKKLIEIEINIDKELHHFNIIPPGKKRLEQLLSVCLLEEKLFPSVLSEKQMKQYIEARKEFKEKLIAALQSKNQKKNEKNHKKKNNP